jgi:hypothetical protein
MQNQYNAETNGDVEHNDNDRDDIIQHEDEVEQELEEDDQASRRTSQSGLSPEVRRKWKLAGQIALRAGGDDNMQDKIVEENVSEENSETGTQTQRVHTFQQTAKTKHHREPLIPTRTAAEVEKKAKMMDLQYFLEMVPLPQPPNTECISTTNVVIGRYKTPLRKQPTRVSQYMEKQPLKAKFFLLAGLRRRQRRRNRACPTRQT